MGPFGKNKCVFVGFGPKRTSGAKIIKIGLSGGTGPFSKAGPFLMDGLIDHIEIQCVEKAKKMASEMSFNSGYLRIQFTQVCILWYDSPPCLWLILQGGYHTAFTAAFMVMISTMASLLKAISWDMIAPLQEFPFFDSNFRQNLASCTVMTDHD